MANEHNSSNAPQSPAHPGESLATTHADQSPHTRLRASDPFIRLTLVGSAVLGAVALLPYALMRRQFLALERRLEQATITNTVLQQDVQRLVELSAVRQREHRQLGGIISETRNSLEEVRRAGERRETERRGLDDKLVRGVEELKTVVERTEAAAVERHLAGTEWMRSILSKFRWSPGGEK